MNLKVVSASYLDDTRDYDTEEGILEVLKGGEEVFLTMEDGLIYMTGELIGKEVIVGTKKVKITSEGIK